ncbi:MAG: 30S ribosomal protein S6 [Proteobacteria bacterium]|nr:30S ribosomal protein S6 [Pseudomonadota bacterium]MBQ4360749.1 30S ribosomal protein S6 [Pseudomonadota bacterium]MBQ9242360.1 30S ribosomal protein S6 [Pseudomonadota bacterium]
MAYLVNHPKTVREYETVFILRSDVLDEDRNKVLTRMSNIIEKLDGHILMQEEWGKRKLAYKIQKSAYGIYFYIRYLGYNDMVAEIERNLRILEPVIKYMTVKLGDDVDVEKRKAEAVNEGSCAPKDSADYSSVDIDDEDLDELVDDE